MEPATNGKQPTLAHTSHAYISIQCKWSDLDKQNLFVKFFRFELIQLNRTVVCKQLSMFLSFLETFLLTYRRRHTNSRGKADPETPKEGAMNGSW